MSLPGNPKVEDHISVYGRAIYLVAIIFTIGMFAITSSVLLAAPKSEKAPVVVQKVKKKKMTTLARRAANKQAEEDALVTVKSVQGIISNIRFNTISIEYKANTDIMFYLDDNIAYHRVKGIGDLEIGDRIRIDFDERRWDEVDGFKRRKRLIKTITFVSPKPKGLVSREAVE
ncbi:hypothetical protein IID04_08150 [PVC group bacterium]|nr:hypothetical protein [PVC group bacterium]